MKTLTNLPNLSKAAKVMAIVNKLEKVNHPSIIGASIKKGLEDNNPKRLFETIKAMANDNRVTMEMILGNRLLTEIETIDLTN